MLKIMIDPGHGGDTGAAYTLIQEDDLNLAIALELRRCLNIVGAEVLMTRTDNFFASLEKRIEFEHTEKPDVLVSIHCNAAPDLNAHGFEVWAWKASLSGHNLANRIISRLTEIAGLKSRGLRESDNDPATWQRRFAILAYTWCPSVLVECGFLSNAGDREFLLNPENQKLIALKIGTGIMDWWKEKEEEALWP